MSSTMSSSILLIALVVMAPSLSAGYTWGRPQPSATPSPSPSVMSTETPTGTPSPSVLSTETPTGTPSPSVLSTETPTGTPAPSDNPTGTPSPSVLSTETPTGTPAPSEDPTGTPSPSVLSTETPTGTPAPSEDPTGTPSPSVLSTETPTGTPAPSEDPTGTPSPSVLSTETPTGTPSPSEESTSTPSPTEAPVCESNVFDCVFSCASPEVRAEHLDAFNEVAEDFEFSFLNERDQAAFFGMIKYNTECLSVCEKDVDNDIYQQECPWDCSVKPVEGQTYYPRGPMMLAYSCNYDAMQQATNVTGANMLEQPDSVCDSLYSYWASALFVWQRKEGDSPLWGTSCQEFSSNDQFGKCMERYNQADCTLAGREAKYNRQLAVLEAAKCFGDRADFTVAQMTCMVTDLETPLTCEQQRANGGAAGEERSTTSPWVQDDVNQLAASEDSLQSGAVSVELWTSSVIGFAAAAALWGF